MTGNPLLKWLVIPAVALALLVLYKLATGDRENTASDDAGPRLTGQQAKTLGVDGDTPGDTLRTIVAESRQLKEQISQALSQSDQLRQQNQELQNHLQNIDQRVDNRLRDTQQQVQQQAQGLLDQVQKQLDNLGNVTSSTGSDLPIGLGVQPSDAQQFQQGAASDGLIWVEPQDATPLDANGNPLPSNSAQAPSAFGFPTSFGESLGRGQHALQTSVQAVDRDLATLAPEEARKHAHKVYTLPQNSTLMGSVAMSALIGRVPVDGTVNDPYPFKVMIGPDNLTANGIELPNVAGAIASGTASGDWTLACVRGQIRSLTFVFDDGTVRTLPAPLEEVNGNQNAQTNQNSQSGNVQAIQGGLGWISDPYGIPCIAGERRSNAKEYLTNQSLITAAGAGVAKLLKADENSTSTVFSGNGTNFGSTGTSGNSALNSILSGGVSDIRQWMNKLYGEAFAAVYVKPGAKVAVHLDQQLTLDYETLGRKVDYTSGASHVPANLD
ncbi:TIGR03752 family integrating conjugative element protein [Pseudomonas protegens]|nr:TIGR03752 family integrating conjugative element protein [Pseudomonas protegens]